MEVLNGAQTQTRIWLSKNDASWETKTLVSSEKIFTHHLNKNFVSNERYFVHIV